MAVTLTDAAANRVESFLANRGKGINAYALALKRRAVQVLLMFLSLLMS